MIRIAAVIAPQYVSIFTRVPLVTLKKLKFLETLCIVGIGSPDQVHDVSIKILEIPLLLVLLGEVDTYCSNDTTTKRINFYKDNIEKKLNFLETLYIDGIGSPDQVHYVSIKILEIPLY